MSYDTETSEYAANQPMPGQKRLPPGDFIGREAEQERFRARLGEMGGAGRKGFLGGLLGGKKERAGQSFNSPLVVIEGATGSGKTRLARRLRDLAGREKEFAGRFRTTRLDWADLWWRDPRLTGRLADEPLPSEAILDIFQNYCQRDGGSGFFEEYKAAVEATKKLATTVQGVELDAVWEYRARAVGRSLLDWSNDKPLLLFMDNFGLVASLTDTVFRFILEEAGGRVFFVVSGENLPEMEQYAAPGKYEYFRLGETDFSAAELLRFYRQEAARYSVELDDDDDDDDAEIGRNVQISDNDLQQLAVVTGGSPLVIRMVAFLVQTGLKLEDLPSSHAELVETLLAGPLSAGHPDRLKIYGLATLRRPEEGLTAAMFDNRKDMLPVEEVLDRLNERYAFLFEPSQPMTLHTGVLRPMREWLLEPTHRYDNASMIKVNERALDYLDTRLAEWSINFPTLRDRVSDLKWREWALDKMWHSFWLGEERGWAEALTLLTLGLALRPVFARQVVALTENLAEIGALNEVGVRRLDLFRNVTRDLDSSKAQLRELRVMGQEGGFFRSAMSQFSDELSRYIDELLD
jgi:hypothetical protein